MIEGAVAQMPIEESGHAAALARVVARTGEKRFAVIRRPLECGEEQLPQPIGRRLRFHGNDVDDVDDLRRLARRCGRRRRVGRCDAERERQEQSHRILL